MCGTFQCALHKNNQLSYQNHGNWRNNSANLTYDENEYVRKYENKYVIMYVVPFISLTWHI